MDLGIFILLKQASYLSVTDRTVEATLNFMKLKYKKVLIPAIFVYKHNNTLFFINLKLIFNLPLKSDI